MTTETKTALDKLERDRLAIQDMLRRVKELKNGSRRMDRKIKNLLEKTA